MKITRPGFASFAIIDPSKKVQEEGQYTIFVVAETPDPDSIINEARQRGFEIRYHYTDVENDEGGSVPVRMIVTEIPPGHIQPFHIHENCYEITVVERGEVSYVEHDFLEREDTEKVKEAAETLKEGDMVFDDKGKRHTVANFSSEYTKVITTQTPKPYGLEFKPDWKR